MASRTMRAGSSDPKEEMDIGLRSHPRPSYLEDCAAAPERSAGEPGVPAPPEGETTAALPSRMVVLDLNGTLLVRSKRQLTGRLRPFARALLRYCLQDRVPFSPAPRQGGWQAFSKHRPMKRWEVFVWSSASSHNVEKMLRALCERGDAHLPDRQAFFSVWARPTLVPPSERRHVRTTKDLEVVWYALNMADDSRTQAEQRALTDRAGPEKSALAAQQAQDTGPWNASNTLIIDDSHDKVQLQPFNALLPAEFSWDQVGAIDGLDNTCRMSRDEPMRSLGKVRLNPAPSTGTGASSAAHPPQPQEGEERTQLELAWDAVLRTDTSLLQVLGVLATLEHVRHIARWIRQGNPPGFPPVQQLLPPFPHVPEGQPSVLAQRLVRRLLDRQASAPPWRGKEAEWGLQEQVVGRGGVSTDAPAEKECSKHKHGEDAPENKDGEDASGNKDEGAVSKDKDEQGASAEKHTEAGSEEKDASNLSAQEKEEAEEKEREKQEDAALYWIEQGARACARAGIELTINADVRNVGACVPSSY